MKLRINGQIFDKWSNLSVSRIYDSVCSTFSFDIYFDPWNKVHRQIMLPGAYNEATVISDNGKVLITGVLLSPSFKSSAVRSLVNVSGYSKTGVLQDCEYRAAFDTTQSTGLKIADICRKVCDRFGLELIVDDGLKDIPAGDTDTDDATSAIADYIAEITRESNIVLSHDNAGNLVLTVATDKAPIYDLVSGMPGVQVELSFDGQQMHHKIVALKQGGGQTSQPVSNPYVQQRWNYKAAAINNSRVFNAPLGSLSIVNEYSPGFRPHIVQQTSSESSNIQDVAKQRLAEELKAIQVKIYMVGWELNGEIVQPDNYITITNPECYLFNKTKFFIDRVDYSGDERQQTSVLNCVVPEVYNGKEPVNIFTANGNNTNFNAPRIELGLTNPREEGAINL